jgi:hypothetical protein
MQQNIIIEDGQMPHITVVVTVTSETMLGNTKVITDAGFFFWIDFDYCAIKPNAGDRIEVMIIIYTGIAKTCKPILKQSSIF